jgi:predicted anti-sigma-YlaC factor YlaD
MNCQDIKIKLDELLDGALPAGEAKEIRAHLKRCPDCRRDYNLLRLVAGSVAGLPRYQPGREFNDRIMVALGYQPQTRLVPAWKKALVGAGVPMVALWTGLVAYAIGSRLTLLDALRVLQLAARPKELVSALGLYAVKLGFAANDAARMLGDFGSVALRNSSLPLQLGIASLIAFGVILMLAKQPRTAAY